MKWHLLSEEEEDSIYGTIDYKGLVWRHINRISLLVAQGDITGYMNSVVHLESLLFPFIDKKYKTAKKEQDEKYRAEISNSQKKDQIDSLRTDRAHHNNQFKLLVDLVHRRGWIR